MPIQRWNKHRYGRLKDMKYRWLLTRTTAALFWCVPEQKGDIRRNMPDLAILSPDPQVRVTTLHAMLERFGPTAPDMGHLRSELEMREPDETELATIFREAASGIAAVQGALLRKIESSQPVGMYDVLPQEITYFEGFVGPQPETGDPERYICDVLIPYRKSLLGRDLSRGLDICCLGALRDDLCPGKWIVTWTTMRCGRPHHV